MVQPPPHMDNKQLPIEQHYDRWMRFENFLKFAERKELKDRMKELDPPSLLNYIDPGTIDAIKKHRKDPFVLRIASLHRW